jgi:hypothetical protein
VAVEVRRLLLLADFMLPYGETKIGAFDKMAKDL